MDLLDVLLRPRPRPNHRVPAGLREAPRLSGGLPVVGHTAEFIRDTIGLLFRAHRELGEVAAFDVAHRRMIALFGPRAHEAVFRAPDAVLSPSEAYKIMTPIFGKDVVYDAPPAKMAEQLKMLLPALQDRRMRTYGEAIVAETERTLGPWGETGVVDFVEFCRVLTNFTSARCLLGREFREGMSEEFARVYHDLEAGASPIAYLHTDLPIPSFRRRDAARRRMVEMITKNIAGRRASGVGGEDFLQTLMESTYSDGTPLSEHEITGLLLAAMFAGHHTSSVTTAWAVLELLRHPVHYQRAVEEVDRVFAGGRAVSHAALRELVYLENVVKEALRLHPPLFMLVRVAQEDWQFAGYHVPKGTWVVVSPTVAHRIPEVFREPDLFDPDRFAPPRSEDKQDFAYIAFGGGRHKCLGNAFAILQIKAILALLLGRFDLGLFGDAIEADFHGLVVGPKEPCRIRYRLRARPSVTVAQMASGETESIRAVRGCPAHERDSFIAKNGEAESRGKVSDGPGGGCPVHGACSSEDDVAPSRTAADGRPRIRVDRDLCQGHAVCVGEAPEVFALGRDQKVIVKMPRPPADLLAKARAAARHCPNGVLRIEE